MAYFQTRQVKTIPAPIPDTPPYTPPVPPTPPSPGAGSTPNVPRPGLTTNSVVTLYQVADEPQTLNKKLTGNPVSLQCAFVEQQDIMHPSIRVECNTDLTHYNYAYIDTMHRYYYLHPVLLSTNRYRLMMDIDVLMSYKDGIKECVGTLSKCEDSRHTDKNIADSEYIYERGKALKISRFHPVEGGTYFLQKPKAILVACGGVATTEGGE